MNLSLWEGAQTLLGWPIFWSAVMVATISAIYVTAGADGCHHDRPVSRRDAFGHRFADSLFRQYLGSFQGLLGGPALRASPHSQNFNTVRIQWGWDILARCQQLRDVLLFESGVMMRFMAARSVEEGRKVAVAVLIILMPIAACVVASGGWLEKPWKTRAFFHPI